MTRRQSGNPAAAVAQTRQTSEWGTLKLVSPYDPNDANIEAATNHLYECFAKRPRYHLPPDDALLPVAYTVCNYIKTPLTLTAVNELKRLATEAKRERKILVAAAAIMKKDYDDLADYLANEGQAPDWRHAHLERYKVTVSELTRMPRHPSEDPGYPLKFSEKGKSPTHYTVTAYQIAKVTIQTLRLAGDKRAGLGRHDGPVMEFVMRCLRMIYRKKKLPKSVVIHEAVEKHWKNPICCWEGVKGVLLPPT